MVKTKITFIGCQNGDEGKGKEVDRMRTVLEPLLVDDELLRIDRYQGGGNAGHTIYKDDEVYKFHQIPSGILGRNTYNLIGTGTFVNPRKLIEGISGLRERGVSVTPKNFGISSKAHVTLDYHTQEDQADFNLEEHTTTGNGIKQTARDKAFRTGIRFVEFLDSSLTEKILREKVFPRSFPTAFGSIEKFVSSYDDARKLLQEFVVLETDVINDPKFAYVIQEGAQGFLLSMDNGQFPGITSSNPEQPPGRPDVVVGVYKSYVSSVGIGDRPFVSEMEMRLQDILVDLWNEFGVTTGKRRNLGWFDGLAARYAADTTGIDFVNLTCLDRLEELGKQGLPLNVTVAYEIDGQRYDKWQAFFDRRDVLERAIPIYESFEPWARTLEKDGKTLTPPAQRYVNALQDMIGKPIATIGVGPKNEDTIVLRDYLGC